MSLRKFPFLKFKFPFFKFEFPFLKFFFPFLKFWGGRREKERGRSAEAPPIHSQRFAASLGDCFISHDRGDLSEGDLLYFIKNHSNLTLEAAEDIPLSAVTRHVDYLPVSANAELKDIFERAMDQNFVPVIDDGNHFIGIITRKTILNHFKDKIL